jgi:hypothetical protein
MPSGFGWRQRQRGVLPLPIVKISEHVLEHALTSATGEASRSSSAFAPAMVAPKIFAEALHEQS